MRRRHPGPRRAALLTVAVLTVAACRADADTAATAVAPETAAAPTTGAAGTVAGTAAAPAGTAGPATTTAPVELELDPDLAIAPGTEQVTVTGATPGDPIALVDDAGGTVVTQVADANGAVLFRGLAGGAVLHAAGPAGRTEQVKVMSRSDLPEPDFYRQVLATDGDLTYLTTRDGTTLSATVWLPGPAEAGPYPTVVEYSGYSPSDPGSQGFPQLFNALGYAYVGVNMRGTGCSGGSYRFFEYTQSLDGYDAIEVVATQPWVDGHRVGMVGVSYPGISQLFVAQTRPPSLAAITPLSVLADSYQSTLYPGGILNTGFAVEWTAARQAEARPEGQAWAAARIAAGDDVCAANQALRLQNPDLTSEIAANPYWTDELGLEIAPRAFVDAIDVPVFLAGSWQDEQTGGHFATMLDRFTGTERFYATLLNGLHTESIGPAVLPRWVEFLDLYVARRTPSLAAARTVAPILAEGLFGTPDVALPATDRFAGRTYEEALAAFEAEAPVQVLFESGAVEGYPAGTPMTRFAAGFDAWPVPEAGAATWLLAPDPARGRPGRLTDVDLVAPSATAEYLALPDATAPTFYDGPGDGIWRADVDYDWQQGAPGTYAAFVTPPLADDVAVIGSGSVDLWIEAELVDGSPAGDTDLEVTLSEVRPGGAGEPVEIYVQSGWLRASQRALDTAASTDLRPVHTHREADAAPLPGGEPTLVRVELFPVAHVFRAGSQIRLTVDAPGGNRGVWVFDTISAGERVIITSDAGHESRLVLPVVDLAGLGVDTLGAPDPCALRGQPCRPYIP